MNKSDLIDALADELKIPSHEASSVITTVIETMTEALCRGEAVEIRGFGSFTVREYKSYDGKNPKTGEVVKVKPKKLPFFKVGKELRENVNESK